MKTEEIKSRRIDGVTYRGASRTKMPSVVTMVVDHRFALDASGLFEDVKAGNDRETGLVGIKLVGVYEDGVEEVIDIELGEDPNQIPLIEDEDGDVPEEM